MSQASPHSETTTHLKTFPVRILRQDRPGQKPYWQAFDVAWEPYMNCISVLEWIAATP